MLTPVIIFTNYQEAISKCILNTKNHYLARTPNNCQIDLKLTPSNF